MAKPPNRETNLPRRRPQGKRQQEERKHATVGGYPPDVVQKLRGLRDHEGYVYLKELAGQYPAILRGDVLPTTPDQRQRILDAGILEISLLLLFNRVDFIAQIETV